MTSTSAPQSTTQRLPSASAEADDLDGPFEPVGITITYEAAAADTLGALEHRLRDWTLLFTIAQVALDAERRGLSQPLQRRLERVVNLPAGHERSDEIADLARPVVVQRIQRASPLEVALLIPVGVGGARALIALAASVISLVRDWHDLETRVADDQLKLKLKAAETTTEVLDAKVRAAQLTRTLQILEELAGSPKDVVIWRNHEPGAPPAPDSDSPPWP